MVFLSACFTSLSVLQHCTGYDRSMRWCAVWSESVQAIHGEVVCDAVFAVSGETWVSPPHRTETPCHPASAAHGPLKPRITMPSSPMTSRRTTLGQSSAPGLPRALWMQVPACGSSHAQHAGSGRSVAAAASTVSLLQLPRAAHSDAGSDMRSWQRCYVPLPASRVMQHAHQQCARLIHAASLRRGVQGDGLQRFCQIPT